MKVRLGGAEVSCDVRGSGPPVLFLHAFPLSLAMWEAQAEALASSHLVVRLDARGFGGSPPGDGLLTMERIASDAAALLDHLGLPPAVVCGLSMGGYAALAMVRRHPERIRALVLADTKAGPDSVEARLGRAQQAEAVLRDGTAALAEGLVGRLLGPTSLNTRPAVVSRVRDMILAASPRGVADALHGLGARADSTPTLREVKVPTLLLFGAEDALTPPSEGAAMRQAIAGSRLEAIPEAGHLANLENPAAFDAALLGFLRGLGT